MIHTSLDNFEPAAATCVAIGVFDGVHLGHQAVLRDTRQDAELKGLLPIGLTFDVHPAELVAPERAPEYLCSLSQRVEWMTAPDLVRQAVVARFDEAFAGLSAREFVEQILVGRLRAQEVRVGADFRFGKSRRGGVMDLESMSSYFGFAVSIVHAVARVGERVSSTRIRTLVAQGELQRAADLLGRPFTLRGEVVTGKQLGRAIGYPTVNLRPETKRQLLPANGIYAGYAVIDREMPAVRAAISIGTNPTTDGDDTARKIEAYLMDGFDAELYGRQVDLQFWERVRNEERFDSLDTLVAQMAKDVSRIEQIVPRA